MSAQQADWKGDVNREITCNNSLEEMILLYFCGIYIYGSKFEQLDSSMLLANTYSAKG